MTSRSRDTRAHVRGLLLAAVVAVLLTLFGAGAASAATAPTAQTRVGASTPAVAFVVGPGGGIGAGQRLGIDRPTYDFVLATGVAAKGAASAGDHIVLGILDEGLEATATKVGGRTLMKDPDWRGTLLNAVNDPTTKFTLSLDGFSGSSTTSQVMGAASRGATPTGKLTEWEVTQLYQAGRLGDTTFMRGGAPVPNPFGP